MAGLGTNGALDVKAGMRALLDRGFPFMRFLSFLSFDTFSLVLSFSDSQEPLFRTHRCYCAFI